MRIVEADDLIHALSKLPVAIRTAYEKQKSIFSANVRDPRLHVKKLVHLAGVHSFRVTRDYRVLFYFSGREIVVFFIIDHRKDVYRHR